MIDAPRDEAVPGAGDAGERALEREGRVRQRHARDLEARERGRGRRRRERRRSQEFAPPHHFSSFTATLR